MFTRSRQPGTPQRNQGQAQAQQQNFSGQQGFQGNYQVGNQQNQQIKPQGNNTPFKQAQQQAQMPQQQQQARMNQQQQQMKQQQQQQMMKQQQSQQQQQQTVQQQQQQQPGTPQQAQRLKPILKTSSPAVQQNPNAIKQNQQANNGMEFVETQNNENVGEVQDVPKWRRNRVPGLKVNRKLKRLRMNQRLRKQLQPKNAIMVLNEMKSGVQFTFPENPSNLPGTLFLVHANVDGKVYVGQGISKILARQNAAENALKSLLLEKMTAAAMKATVDAENPDAQSADAKIEKKETNPDGTPMETNAEEQDEIPWSSLASFALYKLFVEWQNQGTVVPITRPGVVPAKAKVKEPKPAVVHKEIPANALSIHPVMLLNQMKPGLTYVEVGRSGVSPNVTFTLGVDIDGREFTGSAKNKKDAKKQTAKAALHGLYNLVYPEETHSDEVMAEVS